MYNVKGPSKIVAKTTRRGISQNIDTFRDHSRNKINDNDDNEIINGPKPIFQNTSKKVSQSIQKPKLIITPQHAEIIKYVNDSWISVCNEIDTSNSDGSLSPNCEQSIMYYEEDPCPKLKNFKPFDLESWWGKRLYTSITNSVNAKC